jgi:hypothetical protein
MIPAPVDTYRGQPLDKDGGATVNGIHYSAEWIATDEGDPTPDEPSTERQVVAACAVESVHFSDLKRMAQSPAHYRYHRDTPFAPTRAMRIGTLVDRMLLGGELPAIWSGTRSGAKWQAFLASIEAKHGHEASREICTQAEFDDAEPIAVAVRTQPEHVVARAFLHGRHQVALEWEMMGLHCSTRGVDVVGAGWISDLKVTQTTEPDRWAWHARRMHYDAQLAFYLEGCRQNGVDVSGGAFLVGVESSAPYPSTVLHLSDRAFDLGARKVHLWLERLRACLDADEWPGYAQGPIEMDAPEEESQLINLESEELDDE